MNRRSFLLTSGSAILSGTAVSDLQKPSLGLEFKLSGVPNKDPSNINSILVGFEKFELIPSYIDDSRDSTVEIKLDIRGEDPIKSETSVNLTNGQPTDRSDISEALPVIKNEITPQGNILSGDIIIKIDHPSVSDTYRKSFTISGSEIAFEKPVGEGSLVGWWPLNGKSGPAVDYSGSNNDGTHSGTIRNVAGRLGLSATSFDGSAEVELAQDSVLSPSDESRTVSAWIRPTNIIDSNVVYGRSHSDSGAGESLRSSSSSDKVSYVIGDGSNRNEVSSTKTLSDKVWYHIVGLRDTSDSEMRIYIDGTLDNTNEFSTLANMDNAGGLGGPYFISELQGGYDQHWIGDIQDLRVYNRALTDPEIQKMYDKASIDVAEPPGANESGVAHYQFEDNVTDSFSSNDGTNNGVSFVDGIRGQAGSFNGSDTITASSPLFDSGELTISQWIRWDGTVPQSFDPTIVNMDTSSNTIHNTIIDAVNGNKKFRGLVRVDSTRYTVFSESATPEDEWIFWCLTYNKDELKLYRNALPISTNSEPSGSVDNDQTGITMGNDYNGSNGFSGLMDDIRIYDKALSQDEIFQLYLYGTRGKDLRTYLNNDAI